MGKNSFRKRIPSGRESFLRANLGERPGKAILVVAEGEITELAYFDALKKKLKLSVLELIVIGKGTSDPQRLTDEALKIQKQRREDDKADRLSYSQVADFDELWIVFDTDVHRGGRLIEGIQYATRKDVKCAHSTPCFEYWLLLHLADTTAQMPDCPAVIRRIDSALKKAAGKVKRYGKDATTTSRFAAQIYDQHPVAIQRAERVRKHHEKAGTTFPCNPSTEVDRLMDSILSSTPPAPGAALRGKTTFRLKEFEK